MNTLHETLGLSTDVVDAETYGRTVQRFRERGITLPTFAQLADPSTIPAEVRERLRDVDPNAPDPMNLYRVHWFNAENRRDFTDVPGHIVLGPEITGIEATIVVALGDRFPMIDAHKVLAAYGCLAPRVLTGEFDPTRHRAIWPSTGNYCRGGVAISRIMACRGVAVLPEGMSAERFNWLESWVAEPQDIVRTVGSESNVKEIYDKCNELEKEPDTFIFNQFSEFANHLVHYTCTGRALEVVFEDYKAAHGGELNLVGFVSATGSAGTIAAGDYLKERYGSKTVAVEALECPTMLYNGYGEHNIQGIGDKHLPLIHNIMDTDFAVAVSDSATDELLVLFNTEEGRRYLVERRGLSQALVDSLKHFGISSICNTLAAIKTARYLGLGRNDVMITIATDSAAMYGSELDKAMETSFGGRFDQISAAETYARHMLGAATDHVLELGTRERERIFNLGYFTWVEQQGLDVPAFSVRREKSFWTGLRELIPAWDALIERFNAEVTG